MPLASKRGRELGCLGSGTGMGDQEDGHRAEGVSLPTSC